MDDTRGCACLLSQYVPFVGDTLFTQAWNFRLGTTGLPPADLYQLADEKGMSSNEIPVIVEEDKWMYQVRGSLCVCSFPLRLSLRPFTCIL
jgi:hypothetical protein